MGHPFSRILKADEILAEAKVHREKLLKQSRQRSQNGKSVRTSVKAYQWTPEELHENYPHVSLSKIYAALSYYWDHQN